MYIPKNMEMLDSAVISSFISEFGFGTLFTNDLQATRLPLLFEPTSSTSGVITGHMARANPHWKNLSGQRVSVLFDGPHSYISPSWYVSSPAVPTWNYASVQCFGTFKELDAAKTVHAINSLIQKYEPELLHNSEIMPQHYIDRLLKALVGFEIKVDEIHAKEKLGQHKKVEDQMSIYTALSESKNNDAVMLASYMSRRGVGNGS